ncbi:hypothetical protein GCM10010358_17100 [Streptomyces minutiscleroticus]|uniref:Ribbon-helix-helix protein CopG domain-containing protein n=1 Tax=Streptomyces minutiscleroticus TaxID=68238 RepID=A0A918KGT4_9ACTN|nr:hypothetical protein GCM10010358_17100 [Streptomyces minutiscleroticus]
MLSLRIDGELLDRLRDRAAKRGMSVQDYVARTLMRDDFDERFRTAVEETERFYESGGPRPDGARPAEALDRPPPPGPGRPLGTGRGRR